jgi:gliding motility-associated-like protein
VFGFDTRALHLGYEAFALIFKFLHVKTTKLLTFIAALWLLPTVAQSQCDLITVNGSTQMPDGVCAPVTFGMEAHFEFLVPVDTSLVEILYRWNDAANTETLVSGNWNAAGDSVWAMATHVYPPDDECSKTAEAIVVYDGELCVSSGYQSQVFATWGTDEENSGELLIDPVTYYVCEGVDVIDFTFADNSTFNCNVNIEADRPNRLDRWVQFFYNSYNQAGDRIPDVTVRDSSGTVHSMTDGSGNYITDLYGPVVRHPYPADGPTETSYEITAPAGGVAGDIFEITLRNWNVCNPYDNTPNDGHPPADIINVDNPPIETTARIEVIAPTPVTVPALFEYCTGDNIVLSATAGAAEIRWYKDATLDTLLYTGSDYYPEQPPFFLDRDVPGSYTFYVTTFQGICESAPTQVDLEVYQAPEPALAGNDQTICHDTITLYANNPSAGSGFWTTTSTANILSPADSATQVINLEFGPNLFTWTITNGPCNTSDDVIIYSDRQPDAADAGSDQFLCDMNPAVLAATPPNYMGNGIWNVVFGSGSFSDSTLPAALYSGAALDTNILIWRVSSRYGACPVTSDSVLIASDRNPGVALAGADTLLCETNTLGLSGNVPLNNGTGIWRAHGASGTFADSALAVTTFSGFNYGQTKISWNLTSRLEICPVSSDTLFIQRDQNPGIANAGMDKAFCLVTQDTLQGNLPVVGNGSWNVISNPSATPPAFSPNNLVPDPLFSVNPGNEGLYQLEWQLINGTCISRDTVSIAFGVPVPQANAGNDTVACGYDYEMHGNSIALGQGTWTRLSGPGPVTFTPDNHTPNTISTFTPGNEGLYSFEWMFTSGSCPPTSDTVNIEITIAPLPPVFTDLQSCGPDTFSITVPAGNPRNVAYWYTSDTASAHFYKGNTYETGVLSNSTSYYIKLRDTISTCESNRNPLHVTIDEVPDVPVLTGDTLCKPGQGILSGIPQPPANTVIWHSNPAEGALDTNNVLLVDTLSTSQYFHGRGLNTLTGCLSDFDSVRIIVYSEIPPPTTYHDSACGSSSFVLRADKTYIGNTLFWYDANYNFINIGDTLITGIVDTSTVYYVAEYNPITFCQSDFAAANITINSVPGLPQIQDTASCGASTFVLHPTGDLSTSTFRWYDSPVTTALLAEADSFTTPLLIANASYWVAGYNTVTGCEGLREQVDVDIYPSPGNIDILGPTLVLKDQNDVVFFIINGQPGSTYTWDIPAEIVVESNMNDFVRLAFPTKGTFTLSAQERTVDGCEGTPVFHSITVIEDSMAVDIGELDQNACTAEPFEIKPWLFGGTPPYIYHWTGNSEYLTSTNTLFTTFLPPGTGSYTLYLEVVDVNLKVAYDSVVITVHESPSTSILNTDTVACVDENYRINTASIGASPFTHIWSGPIHRLDNYTIANPTYIPRTADTVDFYYRLTDINGCHAYDSITVVSDEPTADFNILDDPGCSPLHVRFENTSQNHVASNWNFGVLGSSADEHPEFTFINTTPEIQYIEVNLSVESPLGCTDNASEYVMVWPNPNAEITALPQTSCNPAHTLLVSTPGNRYYHWSFGDESVDTTSGAFNIYHTYTNNGFNDETFTARVITESSLNCTDTAYLDITVFATPEVDFLVTPETQTFPDNSFHLENETEGNWNYIWSFGDGRGSTEEEPGEVDYEEPGMYTITLAASGDHCSDSISKSVRLYPSPPVAEFKGADNGCMPHTVTLINSSLYADSYLWEFGDGSISTAKDPTYTYYEPGIYKIKLKVSGPGGESQYSDTTRVYIIPNSYFELAPRYVYVNDEPVHYFNLSDNGDVFEWDFGDGNTSTELNPKHIYKQEGTYNVTLKVWTDNGCFDLYVMENAVLVEPSGIVEFPNAFRPNSSIPENRVFKPGIIDHVDDYHLMIFNRWGELIFESFNQETGWDGIYKGKVAKQDVYIWKVKGTYSDGKGFVKTGNVTLLY